MVAEQLVEPIPISEEAPKRGRGRPPKLNPDGTRQNPPKLARPSRPKQTRKAATPRKPSTRKLKEEIAAFLTMANSVVLMTPLGTKPAMAALDPNFPADKIEHIGDELDAYEISALAASIDRQCQRSPRFRKYVERVLGVGSGGTLLATLGIIATRRAARHGMIPNGEAIDFSLGMMLASGSIEAAASAPLPKVEGLRDEDTGETVPNREPIDFENVGTFAEP